MMSNGMSTNKYMYSWKVVVILEWLVFMMRIWYEPCLYSTNKHKLVSKYSNKSDKKN